MQLQHSLGLDLTQRPHRMEHDNLGRASQELVALLAVFCGLVDNTEHRHFGQCIINTAVSSDSVISTSVVNM